MAEAPLTPPHSVLDPLPSWASSTLPGWWRQGCELVKQAVWLGRGREVLFLLPSGGNRASTEWLFQGVWRKRENSKERHTHREKERKLDRQEVRVLVYIVMFFFCPPERRREFLIWGWSCWLPGLRSLGLQNLGLGLRGTICRASGSWKLWSGAAWWRILAASPCAFLCTWSSSGGGPAPQRRPWWASCPAEDGRWQCQL